MNGPGMRIEPFRALLYNSAIVESLAEVVAPPYDVISAAYQEELYRRSPYNVVRLELNRDADRYGSSARILREWREREIIVRAPRPAIYLYTQIFTHQGRRIRRDGLVARIRLEQFSPGRILPHERTFAAAKEDRLRLLTATEANLSSIFGLYSGEHPELERLRESVAAREPIATVTDDVGIEHRLRAIEDRNEIATIQSALDKPRVLIADGHHRYETALEYRRQKRAAENDPASPRPYDYTMMTLVACNDPGLVILPTHRIVRHLPGEAIASFATRAREFFAVEKLADPAPLRAKLADAGPKAVGAVLRGAKAAYILRLSDPAATASAAPHLPEQVRQLDVSILHTLVLERIFGLGAAEVGSGDAIEYTIDAAAALEAVASGRADGAFILNPPSIRDLERVCDSAATMPQKSTYFYPKLLTGLAMNPLSD
ncbi:MAG: DUF1015 domain-containing protein [Candidatus Binataceae bacterium]